MPYRRSTTGCPRCAEPLIDGELLTGAPTRECPGCHGMLIAERFVLALARWLARWPIDELPRRADHSRVPLDCPECAGPMRTVTQLGVDIDVCDRDGAWLDGGELQAILAAARRINDGRPCGECRGPMRLAAVGGDVLRRCLECGRG